MGSSVGFAELTSFGCLRQAGQLRNDEKLYVSNITTTYQVFSTVTTPAAETKSIGLPADAQDVMVFARPTVRSYGRAVSPRQLYRDETTHARLP